MKNKIGIIGFGNMGSAIAERIKSRYKVFVFDKDKARTAGLNDISVANSIAELCRNADTLILAVKPQDFAVVLEETKDSAPGKLIISIAAGISTKFIEAYLGKARVIRVMPNLPAKVGAGMICLCKGRYSRQNDLNFAKQLFRKLGRTLILKEGMMDKVTAVSGSGPGFIYDQGRSLEEIKKRESYFITSLTKSTTAIGFAYPVARKLAETTTKGSIAYLEKTKLSPAEAKEQVASRGGTTEAGLKVLHKGGSLTAAVKAALKRARELARK